MRLTRRHQRHLQAVRNSLPVQATTETLADALLDAPLVWTELESGDASRIGVHTRALLLLGAVRAGPHSSEDLLHVDRLEVTLMQAALRGWLSELGAVGERVGTRMDKRGVVAVNAHLVQELAMAHGTEAVLPVASLFSDHVFLLDALVAEMISGTPQPKALAETFLTAHQRVLKDVVAEQSALSWAEVGALWLSAVNQLGGGSQDLTATQAYTALDVELVDAFELLG